MLNVVSGKMKNIQTIINELDEEIPRPEHEVKMDVYGGGVDESRIRATKDGFLRLGVEIMKAAYAESTDDNKEILNVDLDELLTDDSEIQFDWFERVDSITQPERKLSITDRIIPFIIISILLATLACTIIGAGTIIMWLIK